MANRTVILTLQLKVYDEQRRERQDGRMVFHLLGMETCSYSMKYRCFDNGDHICRSLSNGFLLRDIASEVQSMVSSMCELIQRLVHASRPSPDGEPIWVTWTLQRINYFSRNGKLGVGESRPAWDVPTSESFVWFLKRRSAADDNGGERAKKLCHLLGRVRKGKKSGCPPLRP